MQIYDDGTQATPTGFSGGGALPVRVDDFSLLIALGGEVSELRSFADKARSRLETALGSADAVGSYPAGQSFASHHDAVAHVMSTTMDGVSADIETFGSNIVTSAKNYRDTDETAASCMQALGAKLTGQGTADETFNSAVNEHSDQLEDVQMDAGDAETAGSEAKTTEMLRGDDGGAETVQVDAPAAPVSDPGPQLG